MTRGCPYGSHRTVEPRGVLPQPALRVDNDFGTLYDNEILLDVIALNIDSASFTQIEEEAGHDVEAIKAAILRIVAERGKMQNPVTGSGGMLVGRVARIGADLADRDLAVGDVVATLVSLSLTPLRIDEITALHPDIDRVEIRGQAVLFASGIYAKLPQDMSEGLALAALDVAGAPAQTAKMVAPGMKVLVIGAGGKSGMLVSYEATKRVGPTGLVVGAVPVPEEGVDLERLGLCHKVVLADATDALGTLGAAMAASGGSEYDLVINCVNVPGTEMASILPCRDGGTVYFFGMATHFGRAALGAEGVGKDITLVIGNGYTTGHTEITLGELRENAALRELFEARYA